MDLWRFEVCGEESYLHPFDTVVDRVSLSHASLEQRSICITLWLDEVKAWLLGSVIRRYSNSKNPNSERQKCTFGYQQLLTASASRIILSIISCCIFPLRADVCMQLFRVLDGQVLPAGLCTCRSHSWLNCSAVILN